MQTSDEIASIVDRLHGARITLLQVLGINSLKSPATSLEALIGEVIVESEVTERIVTVRTSGHTLAFDLQRTGKAVWLGSNAPFRLGTGRMPTVRFATDYGSVDLTEPAKTKRITVVVTRREE